jgi:hypothetical protein
VRKRSYSTAPMEHAGRVPCPALFGTYNRHCPDVNHGSAPRPRGHEVDQRRCSSSSAHGARGSSPVSRSNSRIQSTLPQLKSRCGYGGRRRLDRACRRRWSDRCRRRAPTCSRAHASAG